MFAILVLMALFTTFLTTPLVMAIYNPARGGATTALRKLQSVSESVKDEFRVLACVHAPGNIPSIINLIDSSRSVNKSRLKLYIMHLVELTERSSSIIMVQRLRKNGFPLTNHFQRGDLHDRVAIAFQAYGQLGHVSVRTTTAISALTTMHEDICHVAESKKVLMILLPFHKRWRNKDGDDEVENVGQGWREVNQKVLTNALCSVALLVDRGFGDESQQTPGSAATVAQRVCIVFFGGPDDREALELGGRMAEHPNVKVTVIRYVEEEGVASKSLVLRPSPNKSRESSYTFSTAKLNPEKEKVSLHLWHFFLYFESAIIKDDCIFVFKQDRILTREQLPTFVGSGKDLPSTKKM